MADNNRFSLLSDEGISGLEKMIGFQKIDGRLLIHSLNGLVVDYGEFEKYTVDFPLASLTILELDEGPKDICYRIEINNSTREIAFDLSPSRLVLELSFDDEELTEQMNDFEQMMELNEEIDSLLCQYSSENGLTYHSRFPFSDKQRFLPGLELEEIKDHYPGMGRIELSLFSNFGIRKLKNFIDYTGVCSELQGELNEEGYVISSEFGDKLEFKPEYNDGLFSLVAKTPTYIDEDGLSYKIEINGFSQEIMLKVEPESIEGLPQLSLEEYETLRNELGNLRETNIGINELIQEHAEKHGLAYTSPFSYQK